MKQGPPDINYRPKPMSKQRVESCLSRSGQNTDKCIIVSTRFKGRPATRDRMVGTSGTKIHKIYVFPDPPDDELLIACYNILVLNGWKVYIENNDYLIITGYDIPPFYDYD